MIEEKDIKIGLVFELSSDLSCGSSDDWPYVFGTYTIKDFRVYGGKVVVVYEDDGTDYEVPLGVFLAKEHLVENAFLMASYPKVESVDIRNELCDEPMASSETTGTQHHKDANNSFKAITAEMCSTYAAKNHDYGNSFSDLFKECGMVYAYGHLAEKLSRIKSLMRDENKVKGESMADSLKDLANYAVLTLMELNEKDNSV